MLARGCLVRIARHERDVLVAGEPRAVLERDGEMDRVERAQAMVQHEIVRRLEHDVGLEREQRQRALFAAVGVDALEQAPPAA